MPMVDNYSFFYILTLNNVQANQKNLTSFLTMQQIDAYIRSLPQVEPEDLIVAELNKYL